MFKQTIPAVLVTALLSASAPAFAVTMVKEVDVSVDLEAIENPQAAEYWTSVSDDLENAIVARLTDRIAEDGAKISVDIDEVELANSWQSAMGTADSKLVGNVNVTHDSNNTVFDSYDLTVTFEQAGPFFLPGTDLTAITTDSQEYYDAMVAAFADHVVTNLK
ncbi:MAG: hypothetical protein WBO29_08105 [Albidovulum sp.]